MKKYRFLLPTLNKKIHIITGLHGPDLSLIRFREHVKINLAETRNFPCQKL